MLDIAMWNFQTLQIQPQKSVINTGFKDVIINKIDEMGRRSPFSPMATRSEVEVLYASLRLII